MHTEMSIFQTQVKPSSTNLADFSNPVEPEEQKKSGIVESTSVFALSDFEGHFTLWASVCSF